MDAEDALVQAKQYLAASKKKLARAEARVEPDVARKVAAREARIKKELAEEIASNAVESDVAFRETLREIENNFEAELDRKIKDAREQNGAKLDKEIRRIEDLHHSTVAQVEADLKQKSEAQISAARTSLQKKIVVDIAHLRDYEESLARLKAEEAALQRAAFKVSSLSGKPVQTSLTKPRKGAKDAVGHAAKAARAPVQLTPNGKAAAAEEAPYSEYSYSDVEPGVAQVPR